jgi:hypothetical protein
LAIYADKKGIDLLYEIAKARLARAPKAEHPQRIEISGRDGKKMVRKR